jgi:hypothetical protein
MARRESVAARAPGFHSSLEERLVALRRRQESGAGGVAWFAALPGCLMAGYIANIFGLFFVALPVSSGRGQHFGAGLIVEVALAVLIGLGCGAGVWYLARWGARSLIARSHAATWYELHQTTFMALVVDDSYARAIQERVEQQWGLRWFSPPPPKNLEHQLEFAACYQLALRRMLAGVGRLDNGPLWQGGLTWLAGGARGFVCGCLAFPLLYGVGFALVAVCAVFYLQRCGALTAYCDFLLYDELMRREPPEGGTALSMGPRQQPPVSGC